MAHRTQRIEFDNGRGQVLAGRMEWPAGPIRGHALFAHCFTCSKESSAATRVARALAARGYAVLRFDFTGLGGSEGEFANTDFSSNVDDLVAAARHLDGSHGPVDLLVGHSLGGAAVLAAAPRIESARAVVTIGAPSDPSHVRHLLEPAREELERRGEAEVTLAGRTFRIRAVLLEDLARWSEKGTLADLDRPLLIMHSPSDQVVPIENARALYEAARHPKSFVSLDGAGHLLGKSEDAEYAAEVLAAWASRYVRGGEGAREATGVRLAEGQVLVEEFHPASKDQRLLQRVVAGGHELLADEPEGKGGENRGPTPYDLLLAALGTCTAMTLRMYARHKKLPLERVRVRLSHDRVHADDCADCEDGRGLERFTREVELVGDLDDAQRKRLLEIADRCPVHRTLEGAKRIETRESDASIDRG
jgi:uncharacterized OsmC-like protein/fermentation-respiration switch protein FrsA (DUF1100 family)